MLSIGQMYLIFWCWFCEAMRVTYNASPMLGMGCFYGSDLTSSSLLSSGLAAITIMFILHMGTMAHRTWRLLPRSQNLKMDNVGFEFPIHTCGPPPNSSRGKHYGSTFPILKTMILWVQGLFWVPCDDKLGKTALFWLMECLGRADTITWRGHTAMSSLEGAMGSQGEGLTVTEILYRPPNVSSLP